MEDPEATTISTPHEPSSSNDDKDAEVRENATGEANDERISPATSKNAALSHRLALGIQSVAGKSKQAISKGGTAAKHAAQAAGSISKKAATTSFNSVAQGSQQMASSISKTVLPHGTSSSSIDKIHRNKVDSSSLPEASERSNPVTESTPEPSPSSVQPEEPPVPTTESNASTVIHRNDDKHLNYSSLSLSAGMVAFDDDRLILWVLVASISFVETLQNLRGIFYENSVPLPVVGAWMLVAFTVGMEVDRAVLVETIKYYVLGAHLATNSSSTTDTASTTTPATMMNGTNLSSWDDIMMTKGGRNPVQMVSRFMSSHRRRNKEGVARPPQTSLNRSRSLQDQVLRNMRFDAPFVGRLARFGRKSKEAAAKTKDVAMKTKDVTVKTMETATGEKDKSHGLGRMDSEHSSATLLLNKMDVQPLCRLRGLDIFQTDCAEAQMSSHPFLVRNGLRSVPTLVVNMMTQWGSILIYFELPEWVADTGASLVEEDYDSNSVKALKRFLTGDDAYRKERLKIVLEFVQAPYPVKLLAPKGAEIPVFRPGLVDTVYHPPSHEPILDECPVWEVTLDFLGNSAIRGMASIVKRYLSSMSVDFGLVLSKPQGQTEDEPEAVLGLWRFDKIVVDQYPTLPSRFEAAGATEESRDAARANVLLKEASKSMLVEPTAAS